MFVILKINSELENYSENVQKRINQLTAKRKQALEEAEAAYNYAEQMKAQNEELRKRLDDLDKGYINEYGSRVETQEAAVKKVLTEAIDAGDFRKNCRGQRRSCTSCHRKREAAHSKGSFRATGASARRAATAADNSLNALKSLIQSSRIG